MGASQSSSNESDTNQILLESNEDGQTKITKRRLSFEELDKLTDEFKNSSERNLTVDTDIYASIGSDLGIDIEFENKEEDEEEDEDEYEVYEVAELIEPIQVPVDMGGMPGSILKPGHSGVSPIALPPPIFQDPDQLLETPDDAVIEEALQTPEDDLLQPIEDKVPEVEQLLLTADIDTPTNVKDTDAEVKSTLEHVCEPVVSESSVEPPVPFIASIVEETAENMTEQHSESEINLVIDPVLDQAIKTNVEEPSELTVEPVEDLAIESMVEGPVEPVIGQSSELEVGPIIEDQVIQPTTVVEPVESVVEPIVEPTVEPVVESVIESTVEPVVESTVQPVVEPNFEPFVEPTVEPVVEPTVEPVVEPNVEPIVEPTVEPVVEPTVEPVIEPTVEPVIEPTVEPVAKPVVEPTVEIVVEPTVEPIVEPTVEPIVEPTVEPVIEPTVEPVVEPTVEIVEELEVDQFAESTPKGLGEPVGQPVVETFIDPIIGSFPMEDVDAVMEPIGIVSDNEPESKQDNKEEYVPHSVPEPTDIVPPESVPEEKGSSLFALIQQVIEPIFNTVSEVKKDEVLESEPTVAVPEVTAFESQESVTETAIVSQQPEVILEESQIVEDVPQEKEPHQDTDDVINREFETSTEAETFTAEETLSPQSTSVCETAKVAEAPLEESKVIKEVPQDETTNKLPTSQDLAESLFGQFKKQEVEKLITDAKMEGARSQANLDADVMSSTLNAERSRWRSRFSVIEENLKKRKDDISAAHNQGVTLVTSKLSLPESQPTCSDSVKGITDCYLANPKEVLRCNTLAQSFDACVSSALSQR